MSPSTATRLSNMPSTTSDTYHGQSTGANGLPLAAHIYIYIYIYTYSSTPRVFRVFWMVVFDGWSLPRKSEKSVKIGKNQPINRPSIQWGEPSIDESINLTRQKNMAPYSRIRPRHRCWRMAHSLASCSPSVLFTSILLSKCIIH